MIPTPAPTKEFFYEHFIKPQTWTTTADCVDYRLVRDGDELLIVFQQSQDLNCYNGLKDWIRNFRCRPSWSPYFKAFIHKGFLKGWLKCEHDIRMSFLTQWAKGLIKSVQVVGYSQGCGFGLLEFARLNKLKKDLPESLKNITIKEPIFFADPRDIWCLFSWNMRPYLKDARLIRTRKDIIPHLPPAWWGYRHIGKVEYLEEPAGFKHPEHVSAWVRRTYHYPEYYLACLPSEKEVIS